MAAAARAGSARWASSGLEHKRNIAMSLFDAECRMPWLGGRGRDYKDLQGRSCLQARIDPIDRRHHGRGDSGDTSTDGGERGTPPHVRRDT